MKKQNTVILKRQRTPVHKLLAQIDVEVEEEEDVVVKIFTRVVNLALRLPLQEHAKMMKMKMEHTKTKKANATIVKDKEIITSAMNKMLIHGSTSSITENQKSMKRLFLRLKQRFQQCQLKMLA